MLSYTVGMFATAGLLVNQNDKFDPPRPYWILYILAVLWPLVWGLVLLLHGDEVFKA